MLKRSKAIVGIVALVATGMGAAAFVASPAANASSSSCGTGYTTPEPSSALVISGHSVGTLNVKWNNALKANCVVLNLNGLSNVSLQIHDSTGAKPVANQLERDPAVAGTVATYGQYAGPVYAISNGCLQFNVQYDGLTANNIQFAKWGCTKASLGTVTGTYVAPTTADKTLLTIQNQVSQVNAANASAISLGKTAASYLATGREQGGAQGLKNATTGMADVTSALQVMTEANNLANSALTTYKADVTSAPTAAASAARDAGVAVIVANDAVASINNSLKAMKLAHDDGALNMVSTTTTLASETTALASAKTSLDAANTELLQQTSHMKPLASASIAS